MRWVGHATTAALLAVVVLQGVQIRSLQADHADFLRRIVQAAENIRQASDR